MSKPFEFFDAGELVDGDLRLVLLRRNPPDTPVKGYCASYDFEMRSQIDPSKPAGKVNFRAGDTESQRLYGGHFGYGVAEEFRGHHHAERAVRLLFPLARKHGFATVWITCNPDNWPSRRTCERLAGELVEIIPLPADSDMYKKGERMKCRYRIEL